MKYLFSLTIISFLILYFLTYCASITPPGGGPRDTIPPTLIQSIPPNKSINYAGNTVVLVYDEYLQIENLSKQLIITPIIQDDYEQKIRRNSIELSFPEPFQDSTTYTFNFQDAIQDITEGNVTLDNVLAFSTGDYIDSLHINGKVLYLFNNQPVEDYTVCLYYLDDTLDLFNSPPVYLTKTDEEGKYLIENIKNGNYRLYTYNDANSNLICDMPKETFGFTSDTIFLQNNVDSVTLKAQYLDMRNISIQRAGPAGQYYEIKTNKYIVDYTIRPMDSSKLIYHNFGEDRRTIRLYNTIHSTDSVGFVFSAKDSLDNVYSDSLYMKFLESKRAKTLFNFSVTPKNKSRIRDDFFAELQFSKPLIAVNPDSLYFEYDSVTYQYLDDSIALELNERRDRLSFNIQLFFSKYIESLAKADTLVQKADSLDPGRGNAGGGNPSQRNLLFHIGKGAFVSADRDTSESLTLEYRLFQPQNFGSISGNVISAYDSFTIQLIKGKNDVIEEISNQKQYAFNYVEPGKYAIRVFIDNNNNGKWEAGNIFKNIEPENIYFFPEEITIRQNWELTDINLEF